MKNLEDLRTLKEKCVAQVAETVQGKTVILVGMGTCGIAAGAKQVVTALEQELASHKITNVVIKQTGCIGMCEQEVLVDIKRPGEARVTYGKVKPEHAKALVEEHILGGKAVKDLAVGRYPDGDEDKGYNDVPKYSDIDFCKKQQHLVLGHCGVIDPDSLEEYVALGGYEGLCKAVTTMTPEQVIDEVIKSGLRGRGGGGFPTGKKWQFARASKADQKYIICNADEGDPGAFMDRSVMEGDPHRMVEGIAIGGYAIGASVGYIYARAEYPLAIKRLNKAIQDAEKAGFLGDNIFGTGFSFHLEVKQGAGAFVCGEETALMQSIEGKRGMPRPRPPFPAVSGLWGKPSNINNVETYANVAMIIVNGGDWYASMGTEGSKGTKVFALTGKIKHTGLAEVPMGTTMREIIFDIGGGIANDKKFKAVQIGGPSGGCLPEALLDLPVDYDSLIKAGAMMGSGGLVVMDETTCMVDVARFFLTFTQSESCGKCTPCREGTKRMLEILNRIIDGKGRKGDIELLEDLASVIKDTALCGLGQTAPNPVLATLRYFRNEYEAHIKEHRCPAGACSALTKYVISDRCKGCGLCKRNCPVGAISGEPRGQHVIDTAKCIKCGACMTNCPFKAIDKE